MAGQVLMTISRDEVERARLESEYKYTIDLQSKIATAHRKGEQSKAIKTVKNLFS